MASLKYMHSNLSWSKMLNVVCYNTQHPSKLSKKQQITRLYKNVLHFNYAQNMPQVGIGARLYKQETNLFKSDFNQMLKEKNNSPVFEKLRKKYEDFMEYNYEPLMLNNKAQPYGVLSDKIWVWSDEQIMYDPHGFYKPKNINYKPEVSGVPFFEDFPLRDTDWKIDDNVWQIVEIEE